MASILSSSIDAEMPTEYSLLAARTISPMLRPRENSTRSPNVLAKSGVAKGEEGVRSIDRRWRISTAGKSINLNLLEKHMRPEIYDAF